MACLNRRSILLGSAALIAVNGRPQADDYPTRPVRIIVSFAPGSGTDVFARFLADEFRAVFRQPFVVENRPGAAGQIAATAVARSEPDGYTLFFTSNSSHSVNPHLIKNLPYDPIADFTPIAGLATVPYILVVSPKLPITNGREFVAWCRANKDVASYAYPASSVQVQTASLIQALKVDALAVPYKSSPQALTDLMSDRVSFMLIDLAAGRSLIESGDVRALAAFSAQRTALMPNLPTLQEAFGIEGFDFGAWTGLFGPAKLPQPITERLSTVAQEILRRNGTKERLATLGFEPSVSDSSSFAQMVKEQLAVWGKRVRESGVKVE